jgi:molybdopterin-guanine dinucleotide biosynthesis protein A
VSSARFDAVVLAGGAARRLGGADKPGIPMGGMTMLDRVLSGCVGARRLVVVGPARPCVVEVTWCREDPPGGGPVAALVAGLARLAADSAGAPVGDAARDPSPDPGDDLVVVLAADMPFVGVAVPDLLAAAASREGAVLVDASGRDQPLAAAYRRRILAARLARHGDGHGVAVRTIVNGLDLARVYRRPDAATDCDTWADVATARRAARPGPAQREG